MTGKFLFCNDFSVGNIVRAGNPTGKCLFGNGFPYP
jgi:hypothetical protein